MLAPIAHKSREGWLLVATNKDLEKAIAERTFREDRYYRLNVFSIFVPPLRERRPDIMLATASTQETDVTGRASSATERSCAEASFSRR